MIHAHPRPALLLARCRRFLSLAGVLAIAAALLSMKQLVDWQYDLDERLLRTTGSPRHEAYIDVLHKRLARAGVKQLRFEPVSLLQWSVEAEHWGLTQMLLDLSRVPYADLRKETVP